MKTRAKPTRKTIRVETLAKLPHLGTVAERKVRLCTISESPDSGLADKLLFEFHNERDIPEMLERIKRAAIEARRNVLRLVGKAA